MHGENITDTYYGVDQVTDLSITDIVLIKSVNGCYLKGLSNGSVDCKLLFDSESQLFQVESGNLANSVKFKCLGQSTSSVNKYLKVDNSNDQKPYIGLITGIGDAASFKNGGTGTITDELQFDYQRQFGLIKNVKISSKCLVVNDDFDAINVENCDNTNMNHLFTFEIMN